MEVLEAARTQIAGTMAQTEIANLPVNGRNFVDIALLVPGVFANEHGKQPAFCRNFCRAGAGAFGQ